MQLFDDPETKIVHVVKEDSDDKSYCGTFVEEQHMVWPAETQEEINEMIGGEFDYRLCESCQCKSITKYE